MKNLSHYDDFYLFRYEETLEIPEVSLVKLTLTCANELNRVLEKNGLGLKFNLP